MAQTFSQNLSKTGFDPRKPIAGLLVFTLMANFVFAFVFLPTKESQAVVPTKDVKLNPLQAAWKIIDVALQKITSWTSKISAAVDVWFQGREIIKEALNAIAYTLLTRVLNMITNEIIKWVQGGGKPRFVSNWKEFLENAAIKGGNDFANRYLGVGLLCEPFDMSIKTALLSTLSTPIEERIKCTLEDRGKNLNRFFNNFSEGGGWKTWLKLTEPQNNFYGAYLISVDKMMEESAKAKEAAKSEAESGGGFLGPKKCTECRIADIETGEISTLKGHVCENNQSVECTREEIITPPSVVQYETQKAIDSPRSLVEKQIAALTPSLGTKILKFLSPWLTTIINALINRVIKEGLSGVGISDSPVAPSPGTPLPPDVIPDDSITLSTLILTQTPLLIEQQKLLKENIETQLLVQEQKNLDVLNKINDVQDQTLQALKDILSANCSLPSWTTSQIISSQTNGGATTQIIQITATNIGSMTIKKTIIENDLGSTATYEIQEITTLVSSQIASLDEEIESTQQWIVDIDSAISANQDSMEAAEDYKTLYENTPQPLTPEEKKKLDEAEEKMKTAYDIAIEASQEAAQSQATDLETLFSETAETNLKVVQEAIDLDSARGTAEEPEPDTLYAQLQAVQSKLNEAKSTLSSCQTSSP